MESGVGCLYIANGLITWNLLGVYILQERVAVEITIFPLPIAYTRLGNPLVLLLDLNDN